MQLTTINPATGKTLATYSYLTEAEIQTKLNNASTAFKTWSQTSLTERSKCLQTIAEELLSQKQELAQIMAQEMGKRLTDGVAEVEKCALVCQYYAQNAATFLADKIIKTEARNSYVKYEPLGITFAIMPWNFPFWQVFRAAAPALVAGNTMLLKHASVVPACALAIEKLLQNAGVPSGVFQTLIISGQQTSFVIADPRVREVSLTGSEAAGVAVASLAGTNLKKTVLELGGSDPFIVFSDADLESAVQAATTSRLIVSGQSCIAAKRFIVQNDIYDQFIDRFKESLQAKKLGNPLDAQTDLGPLVNQEAVTTLQSQVDRSVEQGAQCLLGGQILEGSGYFYPPTILTEVTSNMPVVAEETFGPVAAVSRFTTTVEALTLANHPHFGLGASVWTKDNQVMQKMIAGLEVGSVFINSLVKSDPRLPFGGTKYSGYGRELSDFGLYEYVNIKTIWINS